MDDYDFPEFRKKVKLGIDKLLGLVYNIIC